MYGARGLGRAMFAAVMLMIGGVLNIIYGIAAIGNSRFFVANTHYVFGSLNAWGWVTLLIGVAEVLASLSLFGGGTYGRILGIIVGSLAALESLLAIPAYPFLGIAVFALSVWIVYGLAVYRAPDEVGYDEYGTGVPTGGRTGASTPDAASQRPPTSTTSARRAG